MSTLMNKTLLLTGLCIALPASAIELHKDDVNEVHLRGYIAQSYYSTEAEDKFIDSGSRWGIDVKRKIQNDWTAGFTAEWGLNFNKNTGFNAGSGSNQAPQGESGEAMSARLGYVHLSHAKWGTLGLGKQWAVYFDAAAATDAFSFWGTNANGAFNLNTDGGLSGTGRAEQVLTYRNSFYGIKYGLQIQAQDEKVYWTETPDQPSSIPDGAEVATVGNGYGFSLGYRWDNSIEVNASHNQSEIELNSAYFENSGDDIASAVSISYGDRTATKPGIYAALLVVSNENHLIDDAGQYYDGKGYETIIKYTFEESLISVHAGINHMESDDSDYAGEYEYHDTMVGISYPLDNSAGVLFFETRFNDSTSSTGAKNDDTEFATGIRFLLF